MKAFNIFLKVCNIQFFKTFFLIKIYILHQSDFDQIFGFEFLQFFAEAGFPCPSRRSPSDHFLRCVNSDFDIVTATLKGSQRLRVCVIFRQFSHQPIITPIDLIEKREKIKEHLH